jgi:hypothetical protein
MKTRVTLFVTVLALTALLSSCFYSGNGYRRDFYGPRYYAARPYVRVLPPPRVYVNPPRYNYRPRYESRNRYNYNHGNRYQGRRRW